MWDVPLMPGGDASSGWDFFISYTLTDQQWAEWIAWVLEEDGGYRVLVQAWDFVPGTNWILQMASGTRDSTRTIAVLSDTYLSSQYGGAEWQAAWAGDPEGALRKLIIVRIADCERPGLLAGVVSVDLFGLDEAAAKDRLLRMVKAALTGRAKPEASPLFPGTRRIAAEETSAPQVGAGLVGHVFVSYVREDSPNVDRLQWALQDAGIRVWRDTVDLWPGEDWRRKIRQAITSDTLVFLACFSRKSLARVRSYQNEELTLAIEQLRQRRPDEPWIIPVRFDECEIPDVDIGGGRSLASIQRADLFGERFDEGAARLIQAVVRLLGR
jgi:TIR domain